MPSNLLGLIELLFVLGVVLALGIYELISLHRAGGDVVPSEKNAIKEIDIDDLPD